MNIKLSRKEVEKEISEFFEEIEKRSPREVKKIKRLAMNKKIPLKEKRKLFCKYCFSHYGDSKTKVKRGIKSVECENCGKISRWRINSS